MKNLPAALIFCVACCFCLPSVAKAQLQRGTVHFSNFPKHAFVERSVVPDGSIPFAADGPFIAFSLTWRDMIKTEEPVFFIAFSRDGRQWEKAIGLEQDHHAEPGQAVTVSQLYFIAPEMRFFYLFAANQPKVDSITLHFFDPGHSGLQAGGQVPVTPDNVACPCPQPNYMGRLDWCPSGDCPTDATPQFTTATHLIVHHSAGLNVASDWAAVVRSIWDFHVNSNGWDDIGYNWLIDPNGVLYEGRGDGRLGAHFCGANGGTMGVCVMGDFTDVLPTYSAIDKLVSLLSWKACDAGIDPLGSANHASSGLLLPRIAGHRDGPCSTSCPGDAFYPYLPQVRVAVKDRIENVCFGVSSNTANPNNEKIEVFPNPANGYLTIVMENGWTGKVDMSIYDAMGRQAIQPLVFDKKDKTQRFVIEVDELATGIYNLKVVSGHKTATVLILKY